MNAPGPLPFPADGHAPAGHRLGHFELRGVAARNSLGIVYRAWDHELGIAVAIKEYLPQYIVRRDAQGQLQPQGSVATGAFERGRDAFIDETRLLARCDHPSLLRVRQLLRAHGTVYRVMPWCQGWSLAELRREMAAPPDEPALRRLLDEVLGALETWHRVAGPHGSVNPAKILLLDDDRALLLGPGLVRRAVADEIATEPGAHPTSRSFLAPEQRAPSSQSPSGPCTDFFALAQVVRYCITGMLPQSDAPAPQPLAAAVEALYFDAPHVRYDERFLRAIDAAASPTMADRPQTATEFRDWLDHGPRRAPAVPVQPAADAEQVPAVAATEDAQAAAAVDIPVDEPAPAAAPGQAADAPASASARPNASAAPEEEAVDEATVDLIRRVIEAIPERPEAPPHQPHHQHHQHQMHQPERPEQAQAQLHGAADWRMQAAFSEPILRVEDAPDAAPPAAPPARRPGAGLLWLLGALVLGAAGYAAWEWGWPAWQNGMASAAHTPAQPAAALQAPMAPFLAAEAASASASAVASAPEAPASAALATSVEPEEASEPEAAASTAAAQAAATPAPASAPAAASTSTPTSALAPASASASASASTPAPTSAPSSSSEVATVVIDPKAPRPVSAERAAAAPPATQRSSHPDSPRQACGARTQFALYRCMQQQCASAAWARHAQCMRFKATDRVD